MESSIAIEICEQFNLSKMAFSARADVLETEDFNQGRAISKMIRESIESYNSLLQGIVREQLSKR